MKPSYLIFSAGLIFISSFGYARQNTRAQAPGTKEERSGPITRPMIVEIAPNTYFINEFGMNAMYLLVGKSRALLIDTGTGFCDLKGIVEDITDLPYDVALTHGHPDHAGGIGQFDIVYIHSKDVEMATHIPYEQRVEYGEIMRNMNIGYKNVCGYTADNVTKYTKQPEIKDLSAGQVFKLGDRDVTMYDAPGHSPGSAVFLDPYSKILFSGDAANGNVGTRLPVNTTLRYLIRLKELQPQYNRMFTGHIPYAGTIDVYSQKLTVLDDIIEAFLSLLRGDTKTEEVANHLFPDRKSTIAVYGSARVYFDPNKLWKDRKEHIVY